MLRDWALVETLTTSSLTASLLRVHECCEVLFFPIDSDLIAEVDAGRLDIDTEINGGDIVEVFLQDFLTDGLLELELACAWYEDFDSGTRWSFEPERRRWLATQCTEPNELFR
jgi:hypothetical protein